MRRFVVCRFWVEVKGKNISGQCTIPHAPSGTKHARVAAGWSYTVLLRSDGRVMVCGLALAGEWNIPELPAGATYVQASAGYAHILLVRNDGCAVACGRNEEGQCNIPSLNTERSTSSGSSAAQRYVPDTGYKWYCGARVLQLVLRACNATADQIRLSGV